MSIALLHVEKNDEMFNKFDDSCLSNCRQAARDVTSRGIRRHRGNIICPAGCKPDRRVGLTNYCYVDRRTDD